MFRFAYLLTKLFLLNVSNVSAADIDLVFLFFLCKEIFLTMRQLGVLLQLCYPMGKRFTRVLQHTQIFRLRLFFLIKDFKKHFIMHLHSIFYRPVTSLCLEEPVVSKTQLLIKLKCRIYVPVQVVSAVDPCMFPLWLNKRKTPWCSEHSN